MALKLFVDPNEGSRALARGIEKFGEGVGKAIQGYRQKKQLEEQTLGLLANTDPLNISQSPGFSELNDPKKQSEFLLAQYDEQYPSLSAKEGALLKYKLDKAKAVEEEEADLRQQQYDLNALRLDDAEYQKGLRPENEKRLKQKFTQDRKYNKKRIEEIDARVETINQKNDSRKASIDKLKDYRDNADQRFGITGNIIEDDKGALTEMRKATVLANAYSDTDEGREVLAIIQGVMDSGPYKAHDAQKAARSKVYSLNLQDADNYAEYFAPEIQSGIAQGVNIEALTKETFEGVVGPETKKAKQGRFAEIYDRYVGESAAPGFMLEAMGVPSIQQMKSEGRLPTATEADTLIEFDQKFKAADLSLMGKLTDTRTIMQLSAMNVDPKTGKPITVGENDEDEINSIMQANKSIKGLLALLGDPEQGTFEIGGKEISKVETGRLRNQFDKFRKLMSPTGSSGVSLTVFRTQVKSAVSNIARGIFLEVGVLTDADVDRYMSIMADPNNPVEMNVILSEMLLDTVRDKADGLFSTLARGGKNVSAYLPVYASLQPNLSEPLDELIPLAQQGRILPGRSLRIYNPKDKQTYGYNVTTSKDLFDYLKDLKADAESVRDAVEGPPIPSGQTQEESAEPVKYKTSSQQQLLGTPGSAQKDLPNLMNAARFARDFAKTSSFQFPTEREQENLELAYASEGNNSKDFAELIRKAKQGNEQALSELKGLQLRNRSMNAANLIGSKTFYNLPPFNLFLPKGKFFLNR